jgi:Uncharacterized conserved protein
MIAIITDFGSESIYVSQLINRIKSINPIEEIIVITNNIKKHNILEGAFILREACRYLINGTIVVAVVDPGVGSERKPLIVETNKHILVGPDNGVLYLASIEEGIKTIYEIDIEKLFIQSVSNTFHGRDVFAPIAALLSLGYKPSYFSKSLSSMNKIQLPSVKIFDDKIVGEVIFIDQFGNIVTNISSNLLKELKITYNTIIKVKIKDSEVKLPFVKTYSEVKLGDPLILIDSFDLLEIAINQGNAKEKFNIEVGETVSLLI